MTKIIPYTKIAFKNASNFNISAYSYAVSVFFIVYCA